MRNEDVGNEVSLEKTKKRRQYQYAVMVLTFLSYMSFHATRKVPSIVKTVLHPLSSEGKPTYDKKTNPGWRPFSDDVDPFVVTEDGYHIGKAGVSQVNGDYDCKSKNPDDHFCISYEKSDESCALKVGPFRNVSDYCDANDCWVLVCGNNEEVKYYQQDNFMIPAEKSDLDDTYKWHDAADVSGKIPELTPRGESGKILLGTLDTIYLSFYAFFMFPMGRLAEFLPKRRFLAFGMAMTSIFVTFTGLAYYFKEHSMLYWGSIYALQGIFQSTGWPTVVGIMGNWCGHGKRGLIMGIWNAHTSVGNIVGSLVAAASLNMAGAGDLGEHGSNWAMAFFVPAAMMFAVAIAVFFFLVEHPRDVGLDAFDANGTAKSTSNKSVDGDGALSSLVDATSDDGKEERRATSGRSICGGLVAGVQIPGVVPFALCLLFAKCVAYTFIYWTPYYLSHNGFSTSEASYLCTFVDIGGIFGGVFAGYLSDRYNIYAIVAFVNLLLCIPVLFVYHELTAAVGDDSIIFNILLMLMVGAFVNGPYALITTAVSADLGQHKSLKGDKGLMATVTAIIDGCGSIGAAIQGYLVSWIATEYGWDKVFTFLMICCALSAVMITQLAIKEGHRVYYNSGNGATTVAESKEADPIGTDYRSLTDV